MTNVTERIKEGSTKALQYLENGDSVRRACQKAGISVTSLYHTTTPEQREQAYLKNAPSSGGPVASRGPGRRKKIRRRSVTAVSTDVAQLQKELEEANNYIAKLEHKLVRAIVLNERVQ
jgi:hypothetical protein